MPVEIQHKNRHQFISQAGDSGHETLLSEDDQSPTPTVERASSEVIYSTISNGNHLLGRSRRSLAEANNSACTIKANNNKNILNFDQHLQINQGVVSTNINISNNINNNNNNNEDDLEHPPMIGVPNLKGKALIRPIAFRPTPGPNSGASTPTNGPLLGFRPPSNGPDSLCGLVRASPATQSTPYNTATPTNEGFTPGHPLVKEGRRHYGSSQELHVAQPNPAFSKFNSLDRRALNKRGNSNGLLKLVTPPTGPESLPVVGRLTGALLSHFESNRAKNEPERRHSSYDPNRSVAGTGLNNARVSSRTGAQQPSSAININGLPDPFRVNGQSTSVYSSQESLHRGNGTPLRPTSSTGSARQGAGTPQSQALPGTIRTTANGLIPSNTTAAGSTTNLNSRTTFTSLFNNGKDQQDMNQTPSPSDSAVGDLETILKEKDTEINYLRETMEQNEQVIFKVYEEKEKMWERELRKIKGLYDNRLRASQQKSSKMEQALTNQTYQLQNEKRRLERDLDEIKKQKADQDEENEKLRIEIDSLRKLVETSTPLTAAAGAVGETNGSPKSAEIELRVQVRKLKMELEKSEKSEEEKVAEIHRLKSDLDQVTSSVKELKAEALESKEIFETEKAHWLDEKEKVIRYQKQLQLNYVQMYKRNKTLEAEIEALNKTVDELTSQVSAAASSSKKTPTEKSSSNSTQSRLQKTGNSVRARLFKMSLHSESQC